MSSWQSPLAEIYRQTASALLADGRPESFAAPKIELSACRHCAAVADWSEHALLRVAGPDRTDFLNRLTTNKVGSGLHTFLLSVSGRPLMEAWLYDEGESFLLEVPRTQAARALAELDRYHFAEKLEFHDLSQTHAGLAVLGPGALSRLEMDELGPAGLAPFRWQALEGTRCRLARLSVPAQILWVPDPSAPLLWAALADAGFQAVGFGAVDLLRVEAGFPAYGRDYDEETLFLEMAHAGSYSESKGCYPGQEVVARILHQGHVNRRLRGFRPVGAGTLEPGQRCLAKGKERARVTSVASSPEGRLGLGYARREVCRPGTELELEGGPRVRVEERPFARD